MPRAIDLAFAFGQRLALFAAQQRAQLLGPRHQFVADVHQHSLLALQPVGGPFGLRDARLIQRRLELISAGLGEHANQIAQIRRVAVFDFAFARQPLASDQVQFGHDMPQTTDFGLGQDGL